MPCLDAFTNTANTVTNDTKDSNSKDKFKFMKVLSIKAVGLDVDWFAVDPNGKIVHFLSGGGLIPESVDNDYEQDKLYDHFLNLPKISDKVYFNPNLKKYNPRNWPMFEEIAERGIFSFDKLNNTKTLHFLYAYPENCLTIEMLPTEIAAILQKTVVSYVKPGDLIIDIEK